MLKLELNFRKVDELNRSGGGAHGDSRLCCCPLPCFKFDQAIYKKQQRAEEMTLNMTLSKFKQVRLKFYGPVPRTF